MSKTRFGGVDVEFGHPQQPKSLPLTHKMARTTEDFGYKSQVLPKGWTKRTGTLALPCDIIFDRDVAVKVRKQSIGPRSHAHTCLLATRWHHSLYRHIPTDDTGAEMPSTRRLVAIWQTGRRW